MTRFFENLAEFDTYIRSADTMSEADMVTELSNSFLSDPALIDLPDDPFSVEYAAAVRSIHAAVSGFSDYDARTMETWQVDVDAEVARPAAYRNDGRWLADYLESFSHVIRRLDVQPGMRVVDLGCGDAEILLHLARLGCEVVAVDLHPDQIEVVTRKATAIGVAVEGVCATFEESTELGPFDRVLFYQAFHHSLGHQALVESFDAMVEPDGRVVFGAEPVVDPTGPWASAVPYPWGPRLDGLSLRQMRAYGWMELGFQVPYFQALLGRNGWSFDWFTSETNGLVASIVAERTGPGELQPSEPRPPEPAVSDVEPLKGTLRSDEPPAADPPASSHGVIRLARRAAGTFRRRR